MKEPYEEGLAIHLGLESGASPVVRRAAKRRQGIGGVGIELRKYNPGRHRFINVRVATRTGALARVSVFGPA